MSDSSRVPVGSTIFTMGYALDQELSIVDGIVSHKSGSNGRWGMNNLINKGNSGGPIFNKNGYLIGFAVAGIVGWQQGDARIDVDGVNFLIPVGTLTGSSVFDEVRQESIQSQCWQEYGQPQIAATASPATPSSSSAPIPPSSSPSIIPEQTIGTGPVTIGDTSASPLPQLPSWFPDDTMIASPDSPSSDEQIWEEPVQPITFSRSFTVSETKDDHPVVFAPHSRTYEKRLTAETGYTITGCEFVANSANKEDDVICRVDPDAKAATFSFRLTSGPLVDQYRGWWGGTVTLRQQLTAE